MGEAELSPSAYFARSLKNYNADGVVLGYDHDLLESRCKRTSPKFDSTLDLNLIVRELFKLDEYWINREAMVSSLMLFGKLHGFKTRKQSNKLLCSRFGSKQYKRDYHVGGLAAECTFFFRLHAKFNPRGNAVPATGSDVGTRPKTSPDWSRETCISKACYDHGGGCSPSARNLVIAMDRASDNKRKNTRPASRRMPFNDASHQHSPKRQGCPSEHTFAMAMDRAGDNEGKKTRPATRRMSSNDASQQMPSHDAPQQHPPKRQKLIGASGRVTLDVGGTKFVTSEATLRENSAYFASVLSGNWRDDGDELFLDQDHVVFQKLLAYMRKGIIKVEDIDADVLVLAEFLGMERLVLGVKVRWYSNIHFGEAKTLSVDEEIAAAFERDHGGISKAISDGYFSSFLKHGSGTNAEKDVAIIKHIQPGEKFFDDTVVRVIELGRGKEGQFTDCSGLAGALNGVYAKGYTLDDNHNDHLDQAGCYMRFSRMRHPVVPSSATDIFVPAKEEVAEQNELSLMKQFALHVNDRTGHGRGEIFAPPEFRDNRGPCAEANIADEDFGLWLERHNFVSREKELEENSFVQGCFKSVMDGNGAITCGIYSRKIPSANQENSV